MAAQEQQAEALQVPALQQGLPQGGPARAAHEITQVCPPMRHLNILTLNIFIYQGH